MTDLIAGISFTGVNDGLYDVALLVVGILVTMKAISFVYRAVKGG